MPIVPQSAVSIPQQVLPSPDGTYYQNQGNVGYLIGMIQAWNPDLSQPKLLAIINGTLRKIYDRKTWFFNFVKGQIISPQAVTSGQAQTTLYSPTVQGIGTTWTSDIIGRQFRIGYNCPIYTIIDVDATAQTLTLELPWGSPSVLSGYFIIQNYFNFGPNVKYVKLAVNMQLGYKFDMHATQDTLNTLDPWRQAQNFSYICAGMPLAQDGSYLQELYPASWVPQAYPFMCYIQQPNVSEDEDNLPPYMRLDIVAKDCIAEALVIGGPKNNRYYDAAESGRKRQEFEGELLRLANADENLYRTEVTKFGEDLPYYNPGGALWNAQHAVMAGAGSSGSGGYDL
jgi:hypothetical protein